MTLHDDIPRGVQSRNGLQTQLSDHLLPRATFRSTSDIAASPTFRLKADEQNERLFLGAIGGTVTVRTLPDGRIDRHVMGGTPIGSADDRHAVLTAGNRSGKDRSVIIPTLATYTGSVLAIDPKAELFNITAQQRDKGLKQRVIGLDPFGVSEPHVAEYCGGFNPLTILHPSSPTLVEDAGLIADALVIPSGHESHWDDSARAWIETLILHVVTFIKYFSERNLVTVHRLLLRGAEAGGQSSYEALAEEMKENDAAGGAVQDGAADFFEKPEGERGSVLSTARRHARFLSYEAIRRVVSAHDFDLEDLKRERLTVYLCLPAMRLGTCSRWLRLFINLTMAAVERSGLRSSHQVLMCLDEFPVMGHMKTVEDAIGQIAGFGVRILVVVQDFGQLRAIYKDRWESFLGNAGTIQAFGVNDIFTLEWLSKRLGKTSLIVSRRTEVAFEVRDRQGINGESLSVETTDLMTTEEISRFFGRSDPLCRQLVIVSGEDPMILQRVNYESHELFKGKFHEDRS